MPQDLTGGRIKRDESTFAISEQNQSPARRDQAAASVTGERILPNLLAGVDIERPDEILCTGLIRCSATHPAVIDEGICLLPVNRTPVAGAHVEQLRNRAP